MKQAKKKARMGRPPKPLGQVRADLVRLCVTRAEKATLKAAAKRAGQDVSVWLRSVGLEAAEQQSAQAEK